MTSGRERSRVARARTTSTGRTTCTWRRRSSTGTHRKRGTEMAVVRRNAVTDPDALAAYAAGVIALKAEFLGTTTADLGIAGPAQQISTYDLFTVWHHLAMGRLTPPTQGDRNAAHSGPAFLPWHRFMMILLELQLQRVTNDDTLGLPYWNWGADGDAAPAAQPQAALWQGARIGAPRRPAPPRPRSPGRHPGR